jgi:hypothetical protein
VSFLNGLFPKKFDDPQAMLNSQLLASISGQADHLELISKTPIDRQKSRSMVKSISRRRSYLARLCSEVISRHPTGDQSKHSRASSVLKVVPATVEYARRLEASGLKSETAAIRAIKEKHFAKNGMTYLSRWEV